MKERLNKLLIHAEFLLSWQLKHNVNTKLYAKTVLT